MRRLIVTDPARSDLVDIRTYTVARYGRQAADAYDAVLKQAMRDLRDDPARPGSKARPEIGPNIRSYHTAFAASRAGTGVRSPRHFILYFLPGEDAVVVSRILHDSRDLARHVPAAHRDAARAANPKGNGGEDGNGDGQR